jgi:phosphodiesterase/alkaline phosphatase D-like protein
LAAQEEVRESDTVVPRHFSRGNILRPVFVGVAASLIAFLNTGSSSLGTTAFSGVAAGDMTTNDAILWTRTVDSVTGEPMATLLTAQLADEPEFRKVLFTYKSATDLARAGTIKIHATGLQSHTRYFYRFVSEDRSVSLTGQFTTAPRADEMVSVRFAFSGDTHGAYRPYPLMRWLGELKLDFFVFLGDTIYESASNGSPPTSDPFSNSAQALVDYRRKYLENISPVNPGGFSSLKVMFASQGNYTLLDNHELGNAQFQSGGAPPGHPPGKGVNAADPTNDVNGSCKFINQTPGFAALLQAYLDFQPIRERRITAPADCRSDGTWQLYFAQRWGAHAIFINADDRTYRDIQLNTGDGVSDTSHRADNPARTMLGATQLAWLEQTLLDAQRQAVTWKLIAISSPIDRMGRFEPKSPFDGPKTWIGGYRAERNRLLKFIADNHIEHVVFITTDDHQIRVHNLFYLATPGDMKTETLVPGALTVVAGPIGAMVPDRFGKHDHASMKLEADRLAANQRTAGIEPIGLQPNFPGLKQVYREGDPEADTNRSSLDFYSTDTFNYATLEIGTDGKSLAVETWGIDPYLPNRFPEPSEIHAPRRILGFRIDAQ